MLSRTVDSVGERLRQYVAVPSDVSPVSASTAVDIRTFPWIRRLASDYALYSGDLIEGGRGELLVRC